MRRAIDSGGGRVAAMDDGIPDGSPDASPRARRVALAVVMALCCAFSYSIGWQKGWANGTAGIDDRINHFNQAILGAHAAGGNQDAPEDPAGSA